MVPRAISRERADRIARSKHCSHCLEYSFKKVVVKPASTMQRDEFGAVWQVSRVCGVCGLDEELVLDADGEVIYTT